MTDLLPEGRASIDKQNVLAGRGARTINWCAWKVLLPAAILVMFFPFYRYVARVPEPFGQAFAHGDFLLLSVLILMEAAIEGEHVKYASLALHSLRQLSMVLAVVAAVVFAVIKYDVVLEESRPNPSAAQVAVKHEKMVTYAYVNCAVAAVAVLMGVIAYYSICSVTNDRLLKRVGVTE